MTSSSSSSFVLSSSIVSSILLHVLLVSSVTSFCPVVSSVSASALFVSDVSSSSSPSIVPTIVPIEKYTQLLDWLKLNGASIHDGLMIQPSSTAGYGVFVNQPIQENEVLFSIPRKLCVTLDKAIAATTATAATNADTTTMKVSSPELVDDDGSFGKGLQTIIEKAGPGGETVALCAYLAKQYILMKLNTKSDDDGDNNNNNNTNESKYDKERWGPYMALLPWERGINNQEHVLFWPQSKVETLLRGSLCYNEAKSLRREVALSISILKPLLIQSIRMVEGDLSTNPLNRLVSLLPWEQYKQNNQQGESLTDRLDDQVIGDAVKGAFVTLLTRSFADDEDEDDNTSAADVEEEKNTNTYGSEKLVPLLDLLQHSDTPNVRHKVVVVQDDVTDTSSSFVEVRARTNINAGSEIFNQYRSEEDEAMPYSRFFTRYDVPGTRSTICIRLHRYSIVE